MRFYWVFVEIAQKRLATRILFGKVKKQWWLIFARHRALAAGKPFFIQSTMICRDRDAAAITQV